MFAATAKPDQRHTSVSKYGRRLRTIALIVASALIVPVPHGKATEPPDHLLKKIAQREAENAYARDSYTYRQTVTVEEYSEYGLVSGAYREMRDVTFSPERGRYEEMLESPRNTLKRIKLTDKDFEDIRNIQPFLLTNAQVPLYSMKYKGEEMMDGTDCFVVWIEPKQILSGQRFFQGLLWVRQSDFAVVRSEGQAVPQIETLKEQNLFPHFTTLRRAIDGKWFFPVETYADDTLYFRGGPQRMRVVIRYAEYKRFGSDSVIRFSQPDQQKQ
jgi:hypothetical protein